MLSRDVWLPEPGHQALNWLPTCSSQRSNRRIWARRSASGCWNSSTKACRRIAVVFRSRPALLPHAIGLGDDPGSRDRALCSTVHGRRRGRLHILFDRRVADAAANGKAGGVQRGPEVAVVAYGFEHDCFRSFEKRLTRRYRGNIGSPAEKERLTRVRGWAEQVGHSTDAVISRAIRSVVS